MGGKKELKTPNQFEDAPSTFCITPCFNMILKHDIDIAGISQINFNDFSNKNMNTQALNVIQNKSGQ